jgi:hypothetical protein
VFLRLFTPFTVESVRAKLAGELKNTTDKGCCICYFEAAGKFLNLTHKSRPDYNNQELGTTTAHQGAQRKER